MSHQGAGLFLQGFEIFFFGQFACYPRKIELATSQRLTEFVMDLAGNTCALFLANGLQIDRKLAQSLMGFTKLFFRATMCELRLSFTDGAVYRGNKPGKARFENIIGRAAFERLNGDFFAHGAGDEDKWGLG